MKTHEETLSLETTTRKYYLVTDCDYCGEIRAVRPEAGGKTCAACDYDDLFFDLPIVHAGDLIVLHDDDEPNEEGPHGDGSFAEAYIED